MKKEKGRQNEPAPFKLKNQTSVPYLLQQKIVTSSCLVNSHSNLPSSSLGCLLVVAACLIFLCSKQAVFQFRPEFHSVYLWNKINEKRHLKLMLPCVRT